MADWRAERRGGGRMWVSIRDLVVVMGVARMGLERIRSVVEEDEVEPLGWLMVDISR